MSAMTLANPGSREDELHDVIALRTAPGLERLMISWHKSRGLNTG
jgi:hypothetical protein